MQRIVRTNDKNLRFGVIITPLSRISGLQPIPRDSKDNGVAAMLDDRTFCFVI